MGRLRTWGLALGAIGLGVGLMPTALAAPTHSDAPGDPPYSVDLATLDAAVDCDEFAHPDTEPVLLVHGTFTSGHEQFDWNYAPFLRETGHDVCIVTYPDRGLGDMQISAEYVARAVQRIHAESGRSVDMIGHSQGAMMPRWAIKYWPSVRAAIDDFVLLAGPQHGTSAAGDLSAVTGQQPAVLFQFAVDSNFVATLNAGDETPGDIDYTAIYTRLDEVVRPVDPPTAALDADTAAADPHVVNIATQDLCPLRIVEHLTIGTTDALVMRLAVDGLDHDGPTDADRLGVDEGLCNLPDQYATPDTLTELIGQLPDSLGRGFPDMHLTDQEPPLRSYALGATAADDDGAPSSDDASGAPDPADDAPPDAAADGDDGALDANGAVPTDSGLRQIASTGRAIPILAAGIAIAVALLLRMGSSRIRDDAGSDEADAEPTDVGGDPEA